MTDPEEISELCMLTPAWNMRYC